MAPDWDDYRLVKAIADAGGLTRAAARLGINHSTAFRRLAAAEAALEARLFERLRSGYVPTAAGAAMVAAATRMEEETAGFARAVAGRAVLPAGELRVTAPATLFAETLMPILARFRARYPAIVLDLVLSEEALNLSRRDADVAIRASDAPPPTLVGRRLATVPWAIYGRADQAHGPLEACAWVTPGESVGGARFLRFVEARTTPERIVVRLNTVLGLREAIEAGLGIGPLPCMSADRRPALVRLGEPEPELQSSLWLLTHQDLRHSARVRVFMDFVGEALAPMRAALEGRSLSPSGSP
ncbi:LysR substrate-binding domain-containing protein [Methylobacterium sp. A54F]